MRGTRKFERLGRGRLGATSLLAWIRELFRYYYALGARGNLLRAPPPPAREEPPAAADPDETVADSSVEADAAYIAGQHASREGDRSATVTPPPLSPITEEDESDAPIPTATPATDALAAESISLAVWALDASKAVEKEPEPIPAPQPRRWLLRTIAFVGAACATFLALAPRPAFASVVAPIACLAGLEVCGVCGPTCDAVCAH